MKGEKVAGYGGETAWIMNKHGVVSAVPQEHANTLLATKIGYKLAEPEDVPKYKQYPDTETMLTEAGAKRRAFIRKQQVQQLEKQEKNKEEFAKELDAEDDVVELRNEAKRLGIKHSWIKSPEKLAKEIEELKDE